jgi:[protein-PII] uridylyltransferase
MPHASMKKDLRESLKTRLKADRQRIIATFHEDGKPEKLLRCLRQSVDDVLIAAWENADLPPQSSLVAVGCRPTASGLHSPFR